MSIGEVLGALLPDFPDLKISKIRFLEDEGLIQPARTVSSYRKFSHADLARLRYVLTQQRDNYLPLKVIRDNLDAFDRGLELPDGQTGSPRLPILALSRTGSGGGGLPGADDFQSGPVVRLSRAELCSHTGLSEEMVGSLEQYGLLVPDRKGYFTTEAVEIATAVGELSRFGIGARHLRPFRTAADREIGLMQQVVTPMMRQKTPEARGRAEETIRELAALSVRLHAALVRTGLHRELNS